MERKRIKIKLKPMELDVEYFAVIIVGIVLKWFALVI
jgi:F0F1-type ATP synthase assembly protein I